MDRLQWQISMLFFCISAGDLFAFLEVTVSSTISWLTYFFWMMLFSWALHIFLSSRNSRCDSGLVPWYKSLPSRESCHPPESVQSHREPCFPVFQLILVSLTNYLMILFFKWSQRSPWDCSKQALQASSCRFKAVSSFPCSLGDTFCLSAQTRCPMNPWKNLGLKW